jgi:hypothetical protein
LRDGVNNLKGDGWSDATKAYKGIPYIVETVQTLFNLTAVLIHHLLGCDTM